MEQPSKIKILMEHSEKIALDTGGHNLLDGSDAESMFVV
jgi:hypothetical protein